MISIVIPVYNVEKYLARCLNSILNQNYTEIEVIMVNDGSTDRSGVIGKKYCEKDKRVRIIDQSNKGVSAARNRGIELCKGEYVLFVDADDTILDNSLLDLHDVISKTEADVVSFQYQKVQHREDVAAQVPQHEYEVMSGEQAMKSFLQERLIGSSMCTKLVKRSAINNVRFEEGRALNEDKDFVFNLLLQAKKVVNLRAEYYCYWTRKNSATTRPFDERWLDAYYFAKKIYDCICKKMPELESDARYQLLSTCYFLVRQMDKQKAGMVYQNEYAKITKEIHDLRINDILNIASPKRRKGILLIKYAPWLYSLLKG